MHFNLADLFESIVDVVPERDALVVGGQRRTFAQLEERANRLAHHLAGRGVGPGDHVGLYLYNSAEYIEAMFAAFKLRAVPINVNFRYVEDELQYLFDDADLVALLHQRELSPRVSAVRERVPRLRHFIAVDDDSGADTSTLGAVAYEEALASASPKRQFGERSPDDLYIIYTGGTTGMPKGVMWRHEDAFFSCLMGANPAGPPPERAEEVAERAKTKPPMAGMSAAPLIHGAAQLGTMIAMFQGWKAVLVPRFEPRLVWKQVSEERPVSISVVGDAMARPLAAALADRDPSWDLSSLMILSSAGAILSQAVKDELKAHLPHLVIMDAFGASETGSQGGDAGGVQASGGIRFRMNANTSVLDDELQPIAPGSGRTGRIALRGRIPLGYYGDTEKTERTFIVKDDVRWVLPGDLGRPEADGTVTVFGRGSICINSGGEKIFPEEVENALKAHPAVFDAVVVGVPDARWGERVTAIVQTRPGLSPSFEELATHCRARLAGYKVPREVHFVDQIVRSPSGKPDYPWAKQFVIDRSAKA
ncbi:MAG TPA: acyl-CoA synthetase [Myxococcota bacterium]|nr:acyl-CoA synthetase [Myxococcota bacterium]